MSEQVIIRPELLDDSRTVCKSFEVFKADFEKFYGIEKLPDDIYFDAEIEDGIIVKKIIDFTGTIKDAVQIRSWDELARFYADDSIEKYGFRISWLRTVHTSLPWSLEFEEEINRKYEQKKKDYCL